MFFGAVHKLSTEASFRWTHTTLHMETKRPLHCFKSSLNVLGCWLTAWTQTSITMAISSSPYLYPLEVPLPTFLNYFLADSNELLSCLQLLLGLNSGCGPLLQYQPVLSQISALREGGEVQADVETVPAGGRST